MIEEWAKMIARGYERSTKLIEVAGQGAADQQQAGQVAKSVVGSSLVKTAVYGADANWGRVIVAVCYSGAEINPDTIDVFDGPVQLLKNNQSASYSEGEATAYLKEDTVRSEEG